MTRQVTISAAYDRLSGKEVYSAEIRVSCAPAEADVVMERGSVRPSYFGQRTLRRFLLDNKMRDLIRDDLEEAQKAFAPIERTVQMRPESPKAADEE